MGIYKYTIKLRYPEETKKRLFRRRQPPMIHVYQGECLAYDQKSAINLIHEHFTNRGFFVHSCDIELKTNKPTLLSAKRIGEYSLE